MIAPLRESNLGQLVQSVWAALFGEQLELCASEPLSAGEFVSGWIWIHGAWNGLVMLRSAGALARELTREMLELEAVEDADLWDTVGELTNLIAGAVQTLLPAPSELSPPIVIEGRRYTKAPELAKADEVHFCFHGQPLTVMVFHARRAEPGGCRAQDGGEGRG